MSTAIGMVAGRDWWGLLDAWELSVLNPGVSLDEARDYLASVAGAGARCAVDEVALAGVRQARVALERERLLLAASSGTDAAGLESGELASCGSYLMTTGSLGDYGLGVWVWRAPPRQDRHEPGWYLDVTPLGEVDIDSCPDPDARALVEGWRLGAGDPVAAIVLAQAREALHARTDVSAPYLRTRLRYHLARIAAMDLPPERRGDALARLLRTQIDVLTSWPVDPSGIPEAAEVRAWR
jgi:hypothetical protein